MDIPISNKIYQKNQFKNSIETDFKQLIKPSTTIVEDIFTIENLFEKWDDLFYAIPKEGTNSHTFMLNRIAEYLGIDISTNKISELLGEINSLNAQLLNTSKELETIKNVTISQ